MELSKDKGGIEKALKDFLEIDLGYYTEALVVVKEIQEAIAYFILDRHGL